jgi:hypothetical protein
MKQGRSGVAMGLITDGQQAVNKLLNRIGQLSVPSENFACFGLKMNKPRGPKGP